MSVRKGAKGAQNQGSGTIRLADRGGSGGHASLTRGRRIGSARKWRDRFEWKNTSARACRRTDPARAARRCESAQLHSGFFPFHDGERLVYEASWLGVPAARGWFELHRNKKDPSLWNVEAWIETNKVVDLVFRMRDYMRERVAVGSLKAQDIYQIQHENRRANEYTITFDDKSDLVVSTKKNHKGTETHQFISSDPFGPISGAMMALSQVLAPGRRLLFDVFSGTNRYVFDFNVEGRERVVVPVGSYDALKVSPGIVYLSDGKLRRQARETTLWISADKGHLPLRMEAATYIGTVRADLVQIDGPPPVHEE